MNYKPLVGYEDKYVIDDRARVFSLINKQVNFLEKRQSVDKKGNAQVYLWNGHKFTYRKVSRLMAETFLEESRSWVEVVYRDGDKLNCRLNNLELKQP